MFLFSFGRDTLRSQEGRYVGIPCQSKTIKNENILGIVDCKSLLKTWSFRKDRSFNGRYGLPSVFSRRWMGAICLTSKTEVLATGHLGTNL